MAGVVQLSDVLYSFSVKAESAVDLLKSLDPDEDDASFRVAAEEELVGIVDIVHIVIPPL